MTLDIYTVGYYNTMRVSKSTTMYHVTWLLNLLEAMEFVGILCMSMRFTTFLFAPEGNNIKSIIAGPCYLN